MRTVTWVTLGWILFAGCASHTDVAPAASRPPLSDQPTIDFLEKRVAEDPGDSVAWNRLGNTYLRALRQTGNHDYLDKALHCAERSLEALQGTQNIGGMVLMARSRQG